MSARRWTAGEVKEKLRGRHPATQTMGVARVPGAWTCIEEWCGIDLLALCAHSNGGVRGCRYPRIGYEVKVSRADYRTELRKPHKRAAAVVMCHQFYFATPNGLLHSEELLGGRQTELGADGRNLHVPDDVGLVVVDGRGCRIVKEAPVTPEPEDIVGGYMAGISHFARWVSARPDPRHDGVVERARERRRGITAIQREAERMRAAA